MAEKSCFTSDELRAYALGRMQDSESEHISAHVADCVVCEETLAGFDDTVDSVIVTFRQAAVSKDSESSASSDELQRAMDRIAVPRIDPAQVIDTDVRDVVRDYELLDQLGSGGMGTVYRAEHTRLKRIVAIKILPARRLRNQSAVDRFEREMEAIGRLNHPAIVRATDAGEVDGTHFLAMDYVDGIDLARLVKLNGSLAAADACEIIRQAALGLQYAHDQGLIHRDVKPSNMMLERCDPTSANDQSSVTVKLLDLGLALFGSASESVDELTTVGQLMGTLDYMAPEQADNCHGVTATADVYSLGATLFKLLTGTAPYETPEYKTPLRKMKALATVDVPSIRQRQPAIPDKLAEVVDRLLQRNPDQRIQSAAEVAEILSPFCESSNLNSLAEKAMAQQKAVGADGAAEDSLEKPSLKSQDTQSIPKPHTAGEAELSERQPPNHRSTRRVAAAFGVPLLVIIAAVIWLQTNKGTLKISCSDDGIPITIRKGNTDVRHLTLVTGENRVTLQSGDYEIVIPTMLKDQLQIQNGNFQIKRNGEEVVTVSAVKPKVPVAEPSEVLPQAALNGTFDPGLPELEPSVTDPNANLTINRPPSPTFESKTFHQWRLHAQTERSPAELQNAIAAFAALAGDDRDFDAAEEIFAITRRYSCDLSEQTAVTKLLIAAIRHLRKLKPEAVVSSARRELYKDASGNHELIAGWLFSPHRMPDSAPKNADASDWSLGQPEPLRAALYKDDYFRRELVRSRKKIWEAAAAVPSARGQEKNGRGPRHTIDFLIRDWELKQPSADVLNCLEDIVEDTSDAQIRSKAAMVLARYRPNKNLVEPLLEILKDVMPKVRSNDQQRFETFDARAALPALRALSLLDRRAADAVPTLLEIAPPKSYTTVRSYSGVVAYRRSESDAGQINMVIPTIFVVDVIGRIGRDTPEVRNYLAEILKRAYGSAPDPEGEYSVGSGWEASLCDALIIDMYVPRSDEDHRKSPKLVSVNEAVLNANVALRAWQNIAGSPPRFKNNVSSIFNFQPNGPKPPFAPNLVAFRGMSIEESTDPKSLETASLEDLQVRFLALYEAFGPDSPKLIPVAQRILSDETYSALHFELMTMAVGADEKIDQTFAKKFQNASMEIKQTLIDNVILSQSVVQHVEGRINESGVRQIPSHLTQAVLNIDEHTASFRAVASLFRVFDEFPEPLQRSLIRFAEASLDQTQQRIDAHSEHVAQESQRILSSVAPVVEALLIVVQNAKHPLRLEAALALSRLHAEQDFWDSIRPVFQQSIGSAAPDTGWINAALAMPRACNALTFDEAVGLVDLIEADAENHEHRFNVLIPGENGGQMQTLKLSRRSLLTHLIALIPPREQKDRNELALRLYSGIYPAFSRSPPERYEKTTLEKIFEAGQSYRVVDTLSVSEQDIRSDIRSCATAVESAMLSLLGKSWKSEIKRLQQQEAKAPSSND